MPGVEVLLATPRVTIASLRNLLILVWREHPTVETMREVGRCARTVARRNPAGSGLVNVFIGGTPKFTDDVREETARINGDRSLFPLGLARAVLLPGLTGVAVRVFLNTVQLIGRQAARPTQAFNDLSSAAVWLAPLLQVGDQRWTAGEIVGAVTPFIDASPGVQPGVP